MRKITSEGKLYISHSANLDDPEWFIVEPRENPEEQVKSLLDARRTVYEFNPLRFELNNVIRKLRIPWS